MISIKIDADGIFEPEQVRIRKSIDKEDFGRKGLLRADSFFGRQKYLLNLFKKTISTIFNIFIGNVKVCN
ncbi:MAG: hypothetical protein JJU02_05165 [Cryomorphaceae bacterium]|nr:hypothetical protein [Cryomorphaceae bacterium]